MQYKLLVSGLCLCLCDCARINFCAQACAASFKFTWNIPCSLLHRLHHFNPSIVNPCSRHMHLQPSHATGKIYAPGGNLQDVFAARKKSSTALTPLAPGAYCCSQNFGLEPGSRQGPSLPTSATIVSHRGTYLLHHTFRHTLAALIAVWLRSWRACRAANHLHSNSSVGQSMSVTIWNRWLS